MEEEKIQLSTASHFSARIYLGLEWRYSQKPIAKDEVIAFIQSYQAERLKASALVMSVNIQDSMIVLNGQVEPHLVISILRMPKSAHSEPQWREATVDLAKALMLQFDQNRLVIEFHDETAMLERSEEVDGRTVVE